MELIAWSCQLHLEGRTEVDGVGPGGEWMTAEMRHAYLARAAVHHAGSAVALAESRQQALHRLVPRTEVLGRERRGRNHWLVPLPVDGSAGGTPAVWVEPPPGGRMASPSCSTCAATTEQYSEATTPRP